MASNLYEHVEPFRTRHLDDTGPFTFLTADKVVTSASKSSPDHKRSPPPKRRPLKASPCIR